MPSFRIIRTLNYLITSTFLTHHTNVIVTNVWTLWGKRRKKKKSQKWVDRYERRHNTKEDKGRLQSRTTRTQERRDRCRKSEGSNSNNQHGTKLHRHAKCPQRPERNAQSTNPWCLSSVTDDAQDGQLQGPWDRGRTL